MNEHFRITAAEAVFHPVPCSGCRSEGFHGLRYKSDSANYHLCQMCFWRGNMDDKHRDDVFKEYNVWKVPGKPGSSLRRSLRCASAPGSGGQKRLPRFPDQPEQTLDLSNIVPASPLASHNGFHSQSEGGSRHMSPAVSGGYDRLVMARGGGGAGAHGRQFATLPQPGVAGGVNGSSQGRYKNEEHDLIASYARRLAGGPVGGQFGPESSPDDDLNMGPRPGGQKGGHRGQRDQSGERKEDRNLRLVHELELKNAEIMREIARLRQNRATVGELS